VTRNPNVDLAVQAYRSGEHKTYTAAAAAFGVSTSAVWKRINTEATRRMRARENDGAYRNAQKRAWENAHRARCAKCGSPLAAGSVSADGSPTKRSRTGVCAVCTAKRRVDLAIKMMRLRVAYGMSNRDIAARLGIAPHTVLSEMNRLRAAGYDIPLDPYFKNRTVRAAAVGRSSEVLREGLMARGIMPTKGERDGKAS